MAKQRLLVTGLTGFVGTHMQRLYDAGRLQDWELIEQQAPVDLNDVTALNIWVAAARPDAVIHLAAQTFVPDAIKAPRATLETNLFGTLNLLQALESCGFGGAFVYVSSGDVYGKVIADELPITETRPPRPRNPYAVSKAATELLCLQWAHTQPGWRVMIARPFNHIGPGQRPDFVIADAARQLARIKHGLQAPQLVLGDVDVSRDFLAVDDVIAAYLLLLQQGRSGEIYNVCSGHEATIRELLTAMMQIAEVDVPVVQDPMRLRASDQRRVVGDNSKLRALGAWQPQPVLESLGAIMRDWQTRPLSE